KGGVPESGLSPEDTMADPLVVHGIQERSEMFESSDGDSTGVSPAPLTMVLSSEDACDNGGPKLSLCFGGDDLEVEGKVKDSSMHYQGFGVAANRLCLSQGDDERVEEEQRTDLDAFPAGEASVMGNAKLLGDFSRVDGILGPGPERVNLAGDGVLSLIGLGRWFWLVMSLGLP
ncbi:hypothetical protein Dimus_022321, partial [Dionaea muscipula]